MSFLHLTAMKKERGREICVALETKESQDSCNNVCFSFVIYNKGIHITSVDNHKNHTILY